MNHRSYELLTWYRAKATLSDRIEGPIFCLRSTAIIILSFLFGTVGLNAQCSRYLDSLVGGTPIERAKQLNAIQGRYAQVIPLLIEHIDDRRHFNGQSLARSSESFAYVDRVHCGIVSAYLIELVLGKPDLHVEPNSDFFLGTDPSNYVYAFGRITNVNSGRYIQPEELSKLKAIYLKWWKINRAQNLQQLRSDWANGKRPLAGSLFQWE